MGVFAEVTTLSQRRENAEARAAIAKAKLSEAASLYRAKTLKQALNGKRGYEGAKLTRHSSNWTTGGGSANAEVLLDLTRLRERARSLYRDNSYAKKALRTLVTNTVATGIDVKTPHKDVWDRWCEECDADGQLDFYSLQALIARTAFQSGEVLIRLRDRYASEGLSVPLQLQVLEPDYLDTLKDSQRFGSNIIIGGKEFDILGRCVAYWMFDQHPGEAAVFRKIATSKRVPAQYILHVYDKDRPGQVRGVPELHSAIMLARDLDDWDEAELIRKKIEACFAAFVRTGDESRVMGPATTQPSTDVPGDNIRTERLSPGMIEYLRADEDVTFGSPSGVTDSDYRKAQLKKFAAGTGVTYEQLTGDFSDVNFSSMKAGMIEARMWCDQWVWSTFIPMFMRPFNRRWVDTAYISGAIKSQDYKVEYTPPKRPWLDPPKDVAAVIDQLSAGMLSLPEVHRQMGYDSDAVMTEIVAFFEKWSEKLQKLGIHLDFGQKLQTPANTTPNDDEDKPPKKAARRANGAAHREVTQ